MAARSSSSAKKVVKYTGQHEVRTITKDDWKAIDIDDQNTVTWSWRNDWSVPIEDLSETAVNYIKNLDTTGLKIIDVKASD